MNVERDPSYEFLHCDSHWFKPANQCSIIRFPCSYRLSIAIWKWISATNMYTSSDVRKSIWPEWRGNKRMQCSTGKIRYELIYGKTSCSCFEVMQIYVIPYKPEHHASLFFASAVFWSYVCYVFHCIPVDLLYTVSGTLLHWLDYVQFTLNSFDSHACRSQYAI